MSVQDPTYSGNGFEKFFEHVGHDFHVVFDVGANLITKLPQYIQDAKQAATDATQVVPLVQSVISASIALYQLGLPIFVAVSQAGVNLSADAAALAAIDAAIPNMQTAVNNFVAAVKALAVAIGADWTELIAQLTPSAPAPAAEPATAALVDPAPAKPALVIGAGLHTVVAA